MAISLSPALTAPPNPPYAPSWLTLLAQRVDRLPGPAWAYYAGFGASLWLIMTIIQWQAGTYPVGQFSSLVAVLSADIAIGLGVIDYFGRESLRALERVRPGLDVTDTEWSELGYRFSVLPARTTLAWSVLTAGMSLSRLVLEPSSAKLFQVENSRAAFVFAALMIILLGAIAGPLVYLMIRLVREINRTLDRHARINLFELSPFYALSGLTARMAFALVILTTLNFATVPTRISDPVDLAFIGWSALVAGAIFVLPLYGIHNRFVDEKDRLLGVTAKQIEAAIGTLHQHAGNQDWNQAAAVKETLAAFEIELRVIQQIPTWPWQPETFRLIVTALLLPIVLFLFQFLISRLISP